MARKNPKEPIQMTQVDKGWFDGKNTIPYSEMTEKHLANAKIHSQKKELFYFNRASLFNELVELLEKEGERRGIELPDHDTDFHKNRRKLKSSVS